MTNQVARLLANYARHVAGAWPRNVAGPERVLFLVHDPRDERRVRARLGEFALATERAGHGWHHVDLTDAFPRWMAAQRYRDAYFGNPALLKPALRLFEAAVAEQLAAALAAAGPNDVVAVSGVAALFGLAHVSDVLRRVHDAIPGRLAVFFPGEYAESAYRLLEARGGWNYMAVPVLATEGPAIP